jgi:hypothetical protein
MKPHTFYRDRSLMLGVPAVFFRQRVRSLTEPLSKKKKQVSVAPSPMSIISSSLADYNDACPLIVLASEPRCCSVIIDLQHFLDSYGVSGSPYSICRPWCAFVSSTHFVMAGGGSLAAMAKHPLQAQIEQFPEVRYMRAEIKKANIPEFSTANVFALEAPTPDEQPLTLSFQFFDLAVRYLTDHAKAKLPTALDFFLYLQALSKYNDEDLEIIAAKRLPKVWKRVVDGAIEPMVELPANEAAFWKTVLLPDIRRMMETEYSSAK